MRNAGFIFLLLFLVCPAFLFPQGNRQQDSLIQLIATSKEDSGKVKKLLNLGRIYRETDYKKASETFQTAYQLALKVRYAKGQINALNSIADQYWNNTNYEQAIKYYYKAYRVSDSIKDDRCVALSLYNLGWVSCILQHNYKEDGYLYKSLQISQRLNDIGGLMRAYSAFGNYYTDRFNNQKQKMYFDSAVHYTQKGIELCKKKKIYGPLGAFYVTLGDLLYGSKDYASAKFYYTNAADNYKTRMDSFNIVFIGSKIAQCNVEFRNSDEDTKLLIIARAYCKRNESLDLEADVLQILSNVYYKQGKYKEGFDAYKEYVEMKKELDKKSYATSMANLENNYSLEKSQVNVSQLKQANEIQELKNKRKSYFIFLLTGLGIVVLVIVFLLYRQNKLKQQTNTQLQLQNNIIKEKKEEIDHSIQYAKGIQQAILPELSELNERFKESFIFYRPKDVVSGDFYWFAKIENDFICVAADCTGHGVPGALMSIIGTDKINQAVFEKKITEPDKILSFLNVQIKNVLKQHSDAAIQKDGMDIAVLKFNADNTKVEYSAANRPLYLVRNNELTEYKANKTAIAGFTPNNQVFDKHTIDLLKNDSLFIFTDGYADQFGGESGGKKIMTRKLKEMLVSGSKFPANKQKEQLESYFLTWKGTFEQTDDVLVIGIMI